ncbi:MAG: hypothetical protein HY782_27560, partial [Chloroflexi bacterium]|nr:hypothetical protein [Chloroflexota bacterium]
MRATQLDLLIHSTHEAGWKVGGIGAVLDGLLSQPAYSRSVKRTLLVGPYDQHDPLERERLFAPRNGLSVRYSSAGKIDKVRPTLARALRQIELAYHVHVFYGTRKFGAYEHEVLLVDPTVVDLQSVAEFKYHLWQQYGISSYDYDWSSEYDWYIRAAAPAFAALQAIAGTRKKLRAALIAHDWLGLPLAFRARQQAPAAYRLVYYAHEVAAARELVE